VLPEHERAGSPPAKARRASLKVQLTVMAAAVLLASTAHEMNGEILDIWITSGRIDNGDQIVNQHR
jgi:hypothetical protein